MIHFVGAGSGAAVFLSLHISEEFSQDYCRRAEEACRWLKDRDYRILADISTKTVAQFGQPDLLRLAERLGIWAFRVDYGFTAEEIAALCAEKGIRYLVDYLNGDQNIFDFSYERQNLYRAVNQFFLVLDIEEKMDQMNEIAAAVFAKHEK